MRKEEKEFLYDLGKEIGSIKKAVEPVEHIFNKIDLLDTRMAAISERVQSNTTWIRAFKWFIGSSGAIAIIVGVIVKGWRLFTK